uniref:nucleoside-diphosphate kinase n=1 Tax=Capra hircus TaxID=9925 RepID=A0A8C2P9X2_CAPHI
MGLWAAGGQQGVEKACVLGPRGSTQAQDGGCNPFVLQFCNSEMIEASEELLQQHYIDLKDRPFFPGLVKYMNSGPVVAMVWEGLNVVKTGRVMLGETNPADSKPGTIRGDFCIQVGRNRSFMSGNNKKSIQWCTVKLNNSCKC